MKKYLLLFSLLALLPLPAFAATTPSPDANPVLGAIQKQGAKLFYLGTRFGMDGWFIVKDGQVQIAYSTPDNKGTIIGAMFGDNGDNVTATQMTALIQNNKEVAALIASAQKEQAAISQVGSPSPASVSTPVASSNGLPSVTLSPGEKLIHDLSTSATVVMGNPATPEILMIMDPHCPHCQATWKMLKDSIAKGALHLRFVPIGNQDTDNERAAAILLSAPDAMTAWDKYVAGDTTQLAGTPTANALAAVRANHTVIDDWKIDKTPYLVYRGKDGKVKIIQGEPDKASILLSDLGG